MRLYELQRKAHAIVCKAKNDGKIKPKVCAVCDEKKTEAYHLNYTKPLDVVWLCSTHHAIANKNKNSEGFFLTCQHCSYQWFYSGDKDFATCTKCMYKVNVEKRKSDWNL